MLGVALPFVLATPTFIIEPETWINQNRSASWQSGFAYLFLFDLRSGAGALCSPKNFSIHTMSYQRSNLYPH